MTGLPTLRHRCEHLDNIYSRLMHAPQLAYIGGAMPSRPTEIAGASSVPSSFLFAATMNILAPGLSSLLSPGA